MMATTRPWRNGRSYGKRRSKTFILILFSLSYCHQFAESLVGSGVASTAQSNKHQNTAPSNRVFVAGISHSCTEARIKNTFSEFGTIQEVLIIGQDDTTQKRKRLPYCFVTFHDVPSAQRAVAAPKPSTASSVYKEIQYARPKEESRRRSNQSRAKEIDRRSQIEEYGKETQLIVQVQSTHLDRLVDYLHRLNGQNNHDSEKDAKSDEYDKSCRILGSTSASSRNIHMLFLSCGNPTQFARMLNMDPLLARAINKSYIVQPGLLEGNLATEQGCDEFAKTLFDKVSQNKDLSSLRVQVYPPKHQSRLLQSFDSIIENGNGNAQFTIDPKGFTHMASVVEVYQYKGKGWEQKQLEEDSKLYMFGMSPASLEYDVVDTNNIIADNSSGDEVSRAYYKLKEAVGAYETSRGVLDQDFYGSIALDCGSAPGGWTKYLIEHFRCQKVYSIDPGSLSPSVLNLKETSHMQMKIQDALPMLLENEEATTAGPVKIWVSDMCLHYMEHQVDQLLLAKKEGLLAPKAFFVLTLKCVVGHSKVSYDSQVEKVVDKLRRSANVVGVEIFHLFSNRSGERTVLGYIN
ncbi:hypothetical protein ACHAXR_012245 [Thalassiosira sp. AJA248-18]